MTHDLIEQSLDKTSLLVISLDWKTYFKVEKQLVLGGTGGTNRRKTRKEQSSMHDKESQASQTV